MTFQEWLEKHQDQFTTYSYQEIADLARACGFPAQEVYQWLDRRRGGKAA